MNKFSLALGASLAVAGVSASAAVYTPTIAVSAFADSTQMNDGSAALGIDSSLGIVGTVGSDVIVFNVNAADTWTTSGTDANYTFNADGKNPTTGFVQGPYTIGGLTANFGSLVGQIGNGDYFLIGSGYNVISTNGQVGALHLFVMDSDNLNNDGSIAVTLSAVPESSNAALMLAGVGLFGFLAKRKRAQA